MRSVIRNMIARLPLAAGASLLVLFGGCAANETEQVAKPAPAKVAQAAPAEMSAADAEFEAGSKRPPTAKTLYALSQVLSSQGKQAEAEAVLRKLIADQPKFLPAYCDLADSQIHKRRIEEAIQILSAGLKAVPDDAVLLNDRGMAFMLLHNYAAALNDFTAATAHAPNDARYCSNMAAALGMLGRYEESHAVYLQVMSPEDASHNLMVLKRASGGLKTSVSKPVVEERAAAVPTPSPAVVKVEIVPPETVTVVSASTAAPSLEIEVVAPAEETIAAPDTSEVSAVDESDISDLTPDEIKLDEITIDDSDVVPPAASEVASEDASDNDHDAAISEELPDES